MLSFLHNEMHVSFFCLSFSPRFDIKHSAINLGLTNSNYTLYIPGSGSRSVIFVLIQLPGATNSEIHFLFPQINF